MHGEVAFALGHCGSSSGTLLRKILKPSPRTASLHSAEPSESSPERMAVGIIFCHFIFHKQNTTIAPKHVGIP